jgi:hypothetical protein
MILKRKMFLEQPLILESRDYLKELLDSEITELMRRYHAADFFL